MDEVTQQNAALVEQAAAAAQSLQDQASSLSNVVSVFQVTEGAARLTAPQRNSVKAPAQKIAPVLAKPIARPLARPVPNLEGRNSNEWEEF